MRRKRITLTEQDKMTQVCQNICAHLETQHTQNILINIHKKTRKKEEKKNGMIINTLKIRTLVCNGII